MMSIQMNPIHRLLSIAMLAALFVTAGQPRASAGNYSPAGLGTAELDYWLDANYGVESALGAATPSDDVQFWRDRAGSNDAIQTNAGIRPTYEIGGPNNSATLLFGGNGNASAPRAWIETAVSTTTNNFSVFAVAQRNGTHEIETQSITGAGGTSGQYYLFGATNRGADGGSGSGLSLGTNGISAYEHGSGYLPSLATWDPGNNTTIGTGYNIIGYEYTAKQPSIYMNGILRQTGLTSTKPNVFAPYRIGGDYYGGLDGHITEALVFDRVLNTTEKSLVNNYLSSKYDLPTAEDHYQGDTSFNGDYDRDVFGVGRTSVSDAVLNAGNAGLNIKNAVLDNNEFLLAGHAEPTNTLITDGRSGHWQRAWYLDNNGGAIDADLEFDFSDADLTLPSLDNDQVLTLLFAGDSSLNWAPLNATPTLLGDAVTFQLSNLATGYYTLGIATVPEPNSLLLLASGWMLLLSKKRRRPRKFAAR